MSSVTWSVVPLLVINLFIGCGYGLSLLPAMVLSSDTTTYVVTSEKLKLGTYVFGFYRNDFPESREKTDIIV